MDGEHKTCHITLCHNVISQTSSWLLTGKSFTRTASRAPSAAPSWRVSTAARAGSITARAATSRSSGKNALDARRSGGYFITTIYKSAIFSPGYSRWRPEVWRTKLPPCLLQLLSLRQGAGPGGGAQHQGGQKMKKILFIYFNFNSLPRASRLVKNVMTISLKRSVRFAIKLSRVGMLKLITALRTILIL